MSKFKQNITTALYSIALSALLQPTASAANFSTVEQQLETSTGTQLHASNLLLNKNIAELLNEHELPGLVLRIKHKGKVIHFKAHGKVNTNGDELIAKDALFRIFSMSKPITALALLQLVDKGKLSLDDDIRKYLPEFAPFEVDGVEKVVTIHHLLSHTAGFGYGGGIKNWIDIRYLIANPLSRNNTLDDLVDDLSGIDLKFSPGDKFEYSIASDIQGAIIEKVSGMSLDSYLSKNIFIPLNMTDTHFTVPKGQENRLVDMYEYEAERFEEAYVFNKEKTVFVEKGDESDYLEEPILLSGGGGLISTAKDYSQFVSMLLNKGRHNDQTLLSNKLISKMLSSKTRGLDTHFMPRVYKGTGFGYGVGIKETTGDTRKQGTFFWGGMGGTIFWADPKSELEVVAMMQVEDGWIALEKWLIPQVYQLIGNINNSIEHIASD